MKSISKYFCELAGATCDSITQNKARLERGMEKASAGFLAGPPVLAGLYSRGIYQEDGMAGLGYMALSLFAYYVGVLALKSRLEIRDFDKTKHDRYVADAVSFYEKNGNSAPAPKH